MNQDRRLFRGLLPVLGLTAAGDQALADELAGAYERWRALMRSELGDSRATIVWLLGDGLLFNALIGVKVEPADVDAVLKHVATGEGSEPGR